MASSAPDTRTRPAGRPRDSQIDERALAATRELLVEQGWEAMSLRGIAARADVSRAAISRRWRSKAHITLDAILGATPDLDRFRGVDGDGWVRAVVEGSFELFSRPEMRAATPGLLATLGEHDDIRAALWQGFTGPATQILLDVEPAADGPDEADVARDAHAVLVLAAGAALFLSLVATEDDDAALRLRIGELLAGAIGRAAT